MTRNFIFVASIQFDQHPISLWIAQQCQVHPDTSDYSQWLFRYWERWRVIHNVPPIPFRAFVKALKIKGFKQVHRRDGNAFYGLRAKSEPIHEKNQIASREA